jgi:hypothetical protein
MKPSDYIKKGWTQGVLARNAAGTPVATYSPDAVSWCLSGAILAAYPDDWYPVMWRNAYDKVTLEVQKKSPLDFQVSWNDSPQRIQAEVILLLESVGE